MESWEQDYERIVVEQRVQSEIEERKNLRTPVAAGVLFILMGLLCFSLTPTLSGLLASLIAVSYIILGIALLCKNTRATCIASCLLALFSFLVLFVGIDTLMKYGSVGLSLAILSCLSATAMGLVLAYFSSKKFGSGTQDNDYWKAPCVCSALATAFNLLLYATSGPAIIAALVDASSTPSYSNTMVGFFMIYAILCGGIEFAGAFSAGKWLAQPHK